MRRNVFYLEVRIPNKALPVPVDRQERNLRIYGPNKKSILPLMKVMNILYSSSSRRRRRRESYENSNLR